MSTWRALAVCFALSSPLVGQAPPEVDRVVEEARFAASQDRNEEAARLFERAVALDPSRRFRLLREWADQLTWSGRHRDAEPLYREALGIPSPAPGEARRARMGLAFSLSLDDRRLAEAAHEYDVLVREDPSDVEAARHLARVESWRGRQRRARSLLSPLVAANPGSRDAAFDLARAEWWMGRGDLAIGTLDALLARFPGWDPALALRAEILRESRHDTRDEVRVSSQSDDLGIVQNLLEQTTRWDTGRSSLGLRYQYSLFSPPSPDGDVRVQRPALFGQRRFSDDLELHANFSVDLIRPSGGDGHTVPTWDAWLTWWPSDVLRVDLGTRRMTFDNVKSLRLGIAATQISLSAEFTPDSLWKGTVRLDGADLTDGNRRLGGFLEAGYRLLDQPHVLAGVRSNAFRFAQQLSNGYFNPEDYLSAVVFAHGWGRLGRGVWWDLDASRGREWAHPDGAKPTSSAAGRISWEATDRLKVSLFADVFSSRMASSGGFSRATAGLSARWGW